MADPGKNAACCCGDRNEIADNTWSELRIGRPLDYPVQPQESEAEGVQVKIIEYLDAARDR